MKFPRALVVLITLLCIPSIAYCDVIYTVRFDQTSVTLNPGATSTFNILFEETVTDGSAHRLDLGGGAFGLIDGSFQAVFSGLGITTATGATTNPGFDFFDPLVPGNTTVFTQAAVANNPVFGTDIGGGTYQVQLGTITVTAGNPGDTNTLTLAGHPVNSMTIDDGLGGLSYVIDNALVNFGAVNINVSAVPEPSTAALGLMAVGALGWWRRRTQWSC